MSYFSLKSQAEKRYGVSTTRPQDENAEFLRYIRAVNTCHGGWRNWVEANATVKTRISQTRIPQLSTKLEVITSTDSPPYYIVDDQDSFSEMMNDVLMQEVISLDFEFHKDHSYNGIIAVIQVATEEFNFLIDPFTTRNQIMESFVPQVLESTRILKVMCGCDNDVLMTQSNFGCFITCVIDIQNLYDIWKENNPESCYEIMKTSFKKHLFEKKKPITENNVRAEWEKMEAISFKKLIEGIFQDRKVVIDKIGQYADFRVRPMTKFAKYAVNDVHFLLDAFHYLMAKVSSIHMELAFEMTKKKLKKTFSIIKYPTAAALLSKQVKITNPVQVLIFTRLHHWRDDLGRIMDENPNNILPCSALEKLSKASLPIKPEDLSGILQPHENEWTKKQAGIIVALINNDVHVINNVARIKCHVCLAEGHQAWQCVFNYNRSSVATYMNQEENRADKLKQCFRRAYNSYCKNGRWPREASMKWFDMIWEARCENVDPRLYFEQKVQTRFPKGN